ncbi:hypothetical protein T03_3524 [Trichinella britovi]|uniref:Uncharacterized protein n=1 Tax=Trichinella britovi TaxID=45882 RepID=A0A0V1C491_TRIBR|nr:hypothetical protein T03_3524 [Trichinella britovi]
MIFQHNKRCCSVTYNGTSRVSNCIIVLSLGMPYKLSTLIPPMQTYMPVQNALATALGNFVNSGT